MTVGRLRPPSPPPPPGPRPWTPPGRSPGSPKIEIDRHISSRDIATELNINPKTVSNHLSETRYQKKLDTWVPHELTVKNLMDRVSIWRESLLKRNKIEAFLKRMITGDEKRITYDNNVRKDRGRSPEKLYERLQSPYWRQGRWCWVFSGIGKELFIMSRSTLAKPLNRLSTANS